MTRLANVLIGIALVNFFSFVIVAFIHGGDAINGKVEGGKFFVADHGQYTEVSEQFHSYSAFHARSVWVTHSLAILSGIYLIWNQPPRLGEPKN